MERLMAACEQLWHQFRRLDLPIVSTLRPGLSRRQIMGHLAGFPGHLAEEVHQFYHWRNGSNAEETFFPHFLCPSLERALQRQRDDLQPAYDDLYGAYAWQRLQHQITISSTTQWLPLFWDSIRSCEYYMVPSQPSPHRMAPVYYMRRDVDGLFYLAYDSLTAMLETLACCYATGAYRVATNLFDGTPHVVVTDPQRVAQLTLAHNPQRTAWWLAQIPAAHTVTELAAHLDAPDEHAWYALWVLRDPEALPSLIAVLRHGTLRAQAKAAHLLEELKDPRAIPALRGALTDLSPHLQQRAASALRAIDVWESYYFPLTEASYGTYLRARLDWLVSEVQQHAGPLVPLVQPGLSGEAITAHLRPVSGHVSQEVQALYRWQNGESLPHEGTLMPWHRWLPLERAAQVYHQACQRRGPDSPWHATWWPLWVAADGPQAYFVISQPDPHALSPIYTLGTPKYRPALWLAYDSLTTMLTTLAACYAAGAYWLAWTWGSEEPYIDHDPQQVAALTRAYNPVWTAWWLAYTPGTEAQPAHLATLAPAQPPGPPREVFARAVHAFHPWPTPHTVPALLQALRAPEAVARRYAATLLGLLGDHHAVLPLMRALQDGDHLVRWQAAEALGRLGDGRAVPALLQSLVEDRRVATDVAAITLGATDVREAAAQALGLLGDPRAIPALLQGVEVAAVPQVYIQALGTLRASAALPPLLRLLRHPQADVRGTTAQALAQLGHPQAVKPLGYALADPIPMVRWRAAQALGRLGDPRAVGPLAQAAQDPMPLVREAAQYARHRLQQHA